MALRKRLLAEIRDLQRRGRIAVRNLGFRGAVRDILYDDQEEFFYETVGSARRKPGYVRVSTAANPSRWYPAPIAARVRCLDALWGWLRPFQILEELNHDCQLDLDGWAYIDRAIAALADVRRAAPAPDAKAVRAWRRRREKEIELQARAMGSRDPRYPKLYMTAA
jgi:hypothetical protein